MNKCSLAHCSRRRSEAAGNSDHKLVQLFLRFEITKLLDDCGDRIFFPWLDNLTSFEFVRIRVSDKLPQRFEMLSARDGLIVFFDERDRHKGADYTERQRPDYNHRR